MTWWLWAKKTQTLSHSTGGARVNLPRHASCKQREQHGRCRDTEIKNIQRAQAKAPDSGRLPGRIQVMGKTCSAPHPCYTTEEQQAYLNMSLNIMLETAISSKIYSDTPIFQDEEHSENNFCIRHLEDIFLRKYPLATHRYNYMNAKERKRRKPT